MMVENAVIESLKTRRAVRGYADRPVEREKLDAILEAATYAPTGMGAQSPVIVLVESKEVRDKVAALNAGVMGR
ncbi:MAG: nitroreductase family protein, partial [Collinsella sp.]